MLTRVRKWGNSLALRIPKSFAEEAAVHDGSTVELTVSEGRLIIRAVKPRKDYELSTLLEQVTEETLHAEIPTGEPQGRESW